MIRNTSGQKIRVRAFDAAGKRTDVAGDLSMQVDIDGAGLGALTDTSATQIGTSGIYTFDLTQAETNGHELFFVPSCSTSGVELVCLPDSVVYTDRQDEIIADLDEIKGTGFVQATHSLATRRSDGVDLPAAITTDGDPFIIIQGDDYTGVRARQFNITYAGSLAGLNAIFAIRLTTADETTFRFPIEGTTGAHYFNFDITTAQSAALTTGKYDLIVRVEWSTNVYQTLATGFVRVDPFVTPTPIIDS